MGVFALILLPFRVIQIFTGFTFSDLEDFAPVLTLIIGLAGGVLIQRSPFKTASLPLLSLMTLLSFGPILPGIGLFFMARELQSIDGYWPEVMVDSPANLLGHVSPRFDAFFHVTAYLEAFSGAWMTLFLLLFFAAPTKLTLPQRRVIAGLSLLVLLTVLFDPGNLGAWWID